MASTGGYIQAALEQAPNAEGGANAVSSNLFYLPAVTIDMNPDPQMLDTGDELRGNFAEYPNSGVGEYNPSGSLDGRCYPGTLGLLLNAACGGCVTTVGDGIIVDPDAVPVPAGAYQHVFSWRATEIPQTMQLIYAPPPGGFRKSQGVGINELSFKADGGAQTFAAQLLNLVTKKLTDPLLTPSYEAAQPWRAGELAITWLASSAVTEDFDWSIKNGIKTERAYTTGSRFPDAIVYEQKIPVLGGSIPKRSLIDVDYDALLAGTTFAAKLKMTHSQDAATGYKHQMWVELPACQYQSGKGDAIKNERRNQASFDWAARYDVATSKWATITLVNSTPAYATYA